MAVEVTSPLVLLMRKSMRGIPTCMRYVTRPLGPSSRSMATTCGERMEARVRTGGKECHL